MSITSPPPGSVRSWRWVVVWRPSSSSSRVSRVTITSSPSQRLTSVDVPTPEEPRRTAVAPGVMRARRASQPCPLTAETTCTATPSATASTSATSGHGSSSRSALVSTISGELPLSQIVTR